MKSRHLPCYTVMLGLCLAAGAAPGQAALGRPTDMMAAGHVLRYNISPSTPEEVARAEQARRLLDQAKAALYAEDYAKAEALSRRGVGEHSNYTGFRETLAQSLYYQGRTREALDELQAMTHQTQADVSLDDSDHFRWSASLLKTGDWAGAVAQYQEGLSDFNWDRYRQVSGVPCTFSFSVDKPEPARLSMAVHLVLAVSEMNSDPRPNWKFLGRRSLEDVRAALATGPDSAEACFWAGVVLDCDGHPAEARAALRKAVRVARGPVKEAARKALDRTERTLAQAPPKASEEADRKSTP